MITLGGRGGELCCFIHRVGACTCGGTRFCREAVDRQSDKVRADGEFRLVFHWLAVAHIVFRQHKEAILNACFQWNLGSGAYRIDSIQLVSSFVLRTVEFELLDSAAALVIFAREGGGELVGAIGHHVQSAGGRESVNGVQPGVGGDSFIDIEHNISRSRYCVTCDTLTRFGFDGEADKALTAVQRVVDGQEATIDVYRWHTCGGIYTPNCR